MHVACRDVIAPGLVSPVPPPEPNVSSGLGAQPVSEGSLYFSTGVSEDYSVWHMHTQDMKAAPPRWGHSAASLHSRLQGLPVAIVVQARVREVVHQEHNTCSLLASGAGRSEWVCGGCWDTYCGLNTGCSLLFRTPSANRLSLPVKEGRKTP